MHRFILLAFLFGGACSSEPVRAPVVPDAGATDVGTDLVEVDMGRVQLAELVISPSPAELNVGTTLELEVSVLDETGDEVASVATWSSSEPDIVEVTAGGVLIGHQLGDATVTATYQGVSGEVDVRVVGPPIGELVVTPASRVMNIGESFTLTVSLYDELGAPIEDARTVAYATTDSSVATVQDGLVTAVSEGAATVTTEVEGYRFDTEIEVLPPVTIDRAEVSPVATNVSLGESITFEARGFVGGTEEPGVVFVWSSTNEEVVVVQPDGSATAVGVGSAEVVATAGAVEARATIEVDFLFTDIASGDGFGCGVVGTGVFCWGRTTDGQIGGTTSPNRVALPFDASAVVTGAAHACALSTTGAAACWGHGSPTPTVVNGFTFSSLMAGRDTTCGRQNGQLWCWEGAASPSPNSTYSSIDWGVRHTCATDGTSASCWGENDRGQLGLNVTGGSYATPQDVTGGYDFELVVAGDLHTCGTTVAGTSACWGANGSGQLGDGTSTDRSTPILLGGVASITRLTAGSEFTCGLSSDGGAFCWGENGAGQLGDATTTNRDVPTPVNSAIRFTKIAAGAEHVCGVSTSGELLCWGAGTQGELVSPGASSSPRAVDWTDFVP